MSRPLFTPEELAELAAFDAEIQDEPEYDPEEIKAARERDFQARQKGRDDRERAIAEYKRGYREANKEAIAEYKRGYYAANKEAIAEYKRGYRAAGSDAVAEVSELRRWRRERHYSQAMAARMLKVSQGTISNIERGISPMPERIREAIHEISSDERPHMLAMRAERQRGSAGQAPHLRGR